MSRARRLLAGLLAAGALLTATAGCAQSVDPIERLGRKAAQKVQGPHRVPAAGPEGMSGAKAGARGDHGAPGSWPVTACGRRDRQDSADSRPSPPPRHRWPDRPESYDAVDPDAMDPGDGCERR
ncbi:hypothetical protein ACWD9K_15525 [Streptomyces sp. 900116325]